VPQQAVRTRRAAILAIQLVGVPSLSRHFDFRQHRPLPSTLLGKRAAVFLPLNPLKAAPPPPVIRVLEARADLVPGG
jgi:hypothetical protein